MIWMLPLFFVLPVAAYLVYLYWVHEKFSGIPGPRRTSFVSGNYTEFSRGMKTGKPLEVMLHNWHLEHGYNIVVFLFHKPIVSCIDPAIINYVLLQHPRTFLKGDTHRSLGFAFGVRGLGSGIVTETDFDKWAMQRSLLNPAFTQKYIIGLVDYFNHAADELIRALSPLAGTGKTIDLQQQFSSLTLDIISEVAFGNCCGALHGESTLENSIRGMMEGFYKAMLAIFPNWSPFLYQKRRDFQRNVDALRSAAKNVINQRAEALQRQEEIPSDILSIMVKAHAQDPSFTMDLLLDNVITFFVAGEETSATALAFLFMELGRHPEIMRLMVEEVDSQIGKKASISYEDVNRLKYCTMVIKETLRLYPVAIGTFRKLNQPLTYGNVHFPRGTEIKFSAFASSRNPGVVADPEVFDPHRFDNEGRERIPSTTYYPFSLGPRSCIGQKFAMVEMKVVIAKLLQRFTMKPDKSQIYDIGQVLTLHPSSGVWFALQDRY